MSAAHRLNVGVVVPVALVQCPDCLKVRGADGVWKRHQGHLIDAPRVECGMCRLAREARTRRKERGGRRALR